MGLRLGLRFGFARFVGEDDDEGAQPKTIDVGGRRWAQVAGVYGHGQATAAVLVPALTGKVGRPP